MDLGELKTKVLSIEEEAQSLTETTSNPTQLGLLNGLHNALDRLSSFVKDEANMQTLRNYCEKDAAHRNLCPLDNLCENVLIKLTDLEVLLKSEIFDYVRSLNESSHTGIPVRNARNSQEISVLTNKLTDKTFLNLLAAYEVLKYLEGHNKTLVILGPNGSGKTSFANYLKKLESHIKVVPASKPIRAVGYIPGIYQSTLKQFNDELYSDNLPQENLLQKLIIGLCTEHDNIARRYFDGDAREESTYEKIKSIFDSFFDVKLDNTGFSEKEIKAQKVGQAPFKFNDMSDGERVAFFYIATVLTAPEKSFIIVDEPENHLNPAIYNKIWDRLIAVRDDCQFIFISHTIDFIGARSNFELVKIKRFVHPNIFEFDFLGNSLEDIQTEYVVEIVGSCKPILFCEGSKSDLDYRIYESIFGSKYTVVPTGNCLSVENSVDACNMHSTTYNIQSAIGIIDSDLKSTEEIDRLKAKKVYTLKCNEIEMLLLDEAVFKKVLTRIYKENSVFEAFKTAFFAKLSERKQHIVKRLVKTQIDEKLRNSIIDDKNNKTKDEIKANLSNIFGSLDVDAMWGVCEEKVSNIISARNYEEALRYCCLEHTEVIVGVGKRFVSDYAMLAVGVLSTEEQLAIHIRNKYFSEIEM